MTSKKVIVYSSSGWAACNQTKEFLSQKGITFTEINISEKPEAMEEMIQKAGGTMATPTVVIGDEVVVGFNPKRLMELLA